MACGDIIFRDDLEVAFLPLLTPLQRSRYEVESANTNLLRKCLGFVWGLVLSAINAAIIQVPDLDA